MTVSESLLKLNLFSIHCTRSSLLIFSFRLTRLRQNCAAFPIIAQHKCARFSSPINPSISAYISNFPKNDTKASPLSEPSNFRDFRGTAFNALLCVGFLYATNKLVPFLAGTLAEWVELFCLFPGMVSWHLLHQWNIMWLQHVPPLYLTFPVVFPRRSIKTTLCSQMSDSSSTPYFFLKFSSNFH